MKSDGARFLKKIHGVEISGQTWSKEGSFRSFSKTALTILVIFCQKGALMVLDMCAKCGLQQNSGSPDMGPFVTPKRLFRLFLENFSLDFANFLSEWGFYGTRCVCKVWRPEKIWFSRYGANSDPEKALSTVS